MDNKSGYTYTRGYGPGFDILISTPKSKIKGVCIPIRNGARFMDGFCDYLKETSYNMYIAKHCDYMHVFTHLEPCGIVNRFGWFLTKSELTDYLIIERGWFKRVRVQSLKDIDNAVETLFKYSD